MNWNLSVHSYPPPASSPEHQQRLREQFRLDSAALFSASSDTAESPAIQHSLAGKGAALSRKPPTNGVLIFDSSMERHGPYRGGQHVPEPSVAAQQPQAMGWGGQAIPESRNVVPYFGKARPRGGLRGSANSREDSAAGAGSGSSSGDQHRQLNHAASRGDSAGFQRQGPDVGRPVSVEELVSMIHKLPWRDPLPDSVYRALHHLDSRATALLLKDLSRVGTDKRAVELFDTLRSLPDAHPLRSLCDVFTFTAMVSMCIFQQDVDRAMELVEDMRLRGVERNVHTYTALMNVCIKCGRLPLALNTYATMRQQQCPPNVVTFNTLIDVYGKLGQWDKALEVVASMKKEGVEPVLRTFNTLIIACNMCGQPREALNVYLWLSADGFTPNSTTYNALISAYGKLAQLDKALEVYQTMVRGNLDRSVITYSSMISACEKAGQWETALRVFAEMQADGCAPNTVTFNSLIAACAQGCQWERASEVFDEMSVRGCAPDVVTYTALISAFERGGQWQRALRAFQQMCAKGCKPDAIVYNAIIDTLWGTGVVYAQSCALQLFRAATQHGHFRRDVHHFGGGSGGHNAGGSGSHSGSGRGGMSSSSGTEGQRGGGGGSGELNLHAMTAGVAMLSLYSWLNDLKRLVNERGVEGLPPTLLIVTDMGKSSREQGNCIIKEAVTAMMSFWDTPFRPVPHSASSAYTSAFEGSTVQVAAWTGTAEFVALLASLFPLAPAMEGGSGAAAGGTAAGPGGGVGGTGDEIGGARDSTAAADCEHAFGAVAHFESTHGLVLSNMHASYVDARPASVSRLLQLSHSLSLRDEVGHDAVLLLDRAASQAKQLPEEVLPALGVAALMIATKQGESVQGVPSALVLESFSGIAAAKVAQMEWNVRNLLADDTSAISTLRCLKIYLERLGFRYLDKHCVYSMAGLAIMLSVEALYDLSLLNCRPSVVAAALLYTERRMRGAVPFWPSMLARMTGYDDLSTPELTVALRVAQRLARKQVYSNLYRQTAISLTLASGAMSGYSPLSPATSAALQQQQMQHGGGGGSGGSIPDIGTGVQQLQQQQHGLMMMMAPPPAPLTGGASHPPAMQAVENWHGGGSMAGGGYRGGGGHQQLHYQQQQRPQPAADGRSLGLQGSQAADPADGLARAMQALAVVDSQAGAARLRSSGDSTTAGGFGQQQQQRSAAAEQQHQQRGLVVPPKDSELLRAMQALMFKTGGMSSGLVDASAAYPGGSPYPGSPSTQHPQQQQQWQLQQQLEYQQQQQQQLEYQQQQMEYQQQMQMRPGGVRMPAVFAPVRSAVGNPAFDSTAIGGESSSGNSRSWVMLSPVQQQQQLEYQQQHLEYQQQQ